MSPEEDSRLPAVREKRAAAPLPSRRDQAARDFASLLVSNIRLYHEEDVVLGRLAGDLQARLGEAIDSARAAYLERFDDEKIFAREVVRILAGGDPRKLG